MRRGQTVNRALILGSALILGCAIESDPSAGDIGRPDAEVGDARVDAARPDAMLLDGGSPSDAAPPDALPPDAALPDAAPPGDGGPVCGPERCNDLDDDCDGRVDEHFNLGDPCTAGVGACVMNGQRECAPNGQVRCSATPGPAGEEICDGLDNDCDAAIDEGVANACGVCGAPPDEVCDGIDNDCDGISDEGLRNMCGQCGPPRADVCNLRDEDCDGQVDEDFVGGPCDVGVGACAQVGMLRCMQGRTRCAIGPEIAPALEQCGDGIDNDCDGRTDEGQPLCEEQIGRCTVDRAPICDGAGWRCPAPQIDPPIPPECELGPENPPRTQVAVEASAVWALPPNADDPTVALLWPDNDTTIIQRVSPDAALLGEQAVAPVRLAAVTRDRAGAGFVGVEIDDIGYRWVRLSGEGAVIARTPHVFERTDEIIQVAEQLAGADIVSDAGGFVIAFGAWHESRLGFYVAHLDADGALIARRDVGAVSSAPRLFKTANQVIVGTTTFNGVSWGARRQNAQLPAVGLYGTVRPDAVVALPVRPRIVRWARAVSAQDQTLYFWTPNDGTYGACLQNGPTRHCYEEHQRLFASDVVFQGADGLLGWFAGTGDGLAGVRVQPIDIQGGATDVPRWIATQINAPTWLRLIPTGAGVLVLWTEAGGLFMQASVSAIDNGDAPLCPPAQRPVPADGACGGPAVCVDPAACVPNGVICGCDGETYPDRCVAMGRAVGVWRQGECPAVGFEPCPDGFYDIDERLGRCRPLSAYRPACGWQPGFDRSQGRLYRDGDAARAANVQFALGACRDLDFEGCVEVQCDNPCPVCGADDQCYGEADVWGEPACF